jgi:potassium voltage-gated channel Eag-related subfamily H protein 8
MKYLTQLVNVVLLLNYFPSQWKVAHIILILKPGKLTHALTSYWPISLLPIVSKVLEKLLLALLFPTVEYNGLIPSHQFGFRQRHSPLNKHIPSSTKSMKPLNTKPTAPQPSLISPKSLIKYGISAFYTSWDSHFPSISSSFSNPFC